MGLRLLHSCLYSQIKAQGGSKLNTCLPEENNAVKTSLPIARIMIRSRLTRFNELGRTEGRITCAPVPSVQIRIKGLPSTAREKALDKKRNCDD